MIIMNIHSIIEWLNVIIRSNCCSLVFFRNFGVPRIDNNRSINY